MACFYLKGADVDFDVTRLENNIGNAAKSDSFQSLLYLTDKNNSLHTSERQKQNFTCVIFFLFPIRQLTEKKKSEIFDKGPHG